MKWLIIGTGNISTHFISGLRKNNENPFAILSRTIEKARKFAEKENINKYFDNLDEALKHVDAVYVATPNAFHYEPALKSIRNNKHVIVEKIMTDSLEKTKSLFQEAKKYNVRLMEAYAPINHDLYRDVKVEPNSLIIADFARASKWIENGKYKTASVFKKETFGGVIPDVGVYPLSFLIDKLGKALDVKIYDKEYLDGVLVEAKLDIVFEKGKGISRVSKIKKIGEGTSIIINGKDIGLPTGGDFIKERFYAVINNFINNKNFQELKFVSLEVARIVEILKPHLFDK